MKYFEGRELLKSLVSMSKRGGSFQKASETVDIILSKIRRDDKNPLHALKTTNHGETRIKHCVKYDLTGASRLITVKNNGCCLLLFVGNHDECDKWLNANEGKEYLVNSESQIVEVSRPSSKSSGNKVIIEGRVISEGKLYQRLNVELYDRLIDEVPRPASRVLESLECYDEKKIFETVDGLDSELGSAILDVFTLTIAGDIPGAERRAMLHLGDIIDLSQLDPSTVVVDSEFLKQISIDSPQYPSFLRQFAETSEYKDWMLFMHPDQELIAFSNFNGPAKLVGVSGSGKTCVVVQRAIYLARKYKGEPILVVTLNKPLAKLIENLVEQLADDELRPYISVQPFFSVCQQKLHEFEPLNDKLYEDVTWKSDEHIDEIWREYYRCELQNMDASIMQPLHDSLISRGFNAERYIREEFDWIRSAFPQTQRENYLTVERKGRCISLLPQQRKLLLTGLVGWEKKMRDVGVTDYLNLSTVLYRHIDKLKASYRCILIDESQDFGNIEFSIARALVKPLENDLFLCGDAAQKISTKYQRLREIGVDVPGSRSKKITKNYRNSKEILEAANQILNQNFTEDMFDIEDFELLDPEYASFSGSVPMLFVSDNLSDELASAITYLKQELKDGQKGCIAIAGFSYREIEEFQGEAGLPVLNGVSDLNKGNIFLSDLEQTKGFEFDYMCIINCSQGVIPNNQMPEEEHYRELSRLYVAMTRAKLELIISYSGLPSTLFKNTEDYLVSDNWGPYLDTVPVNYGYPKRLGEIVHKDDMPESPLDIIGEHFLYREESIGLSQSLIQFIRENVDGVGRVILNQNSRLKRRVKWKTMLDLISDITNLSASEHKVSMKHISELLRAVSLDEDRELNKG
jgi:superfamily I DNA/RNA helicase